MELASNARTEAGPENAGGARGAAGEDESPALHSRTTERDAMTGITTRKLQGNCRRLEVVGKAGR
jgi:hypothetical protein